MAPYYFTRRQHRYIFSSLLVILVLAILLLQPNGNFLLRKISSRISHLEALAAKSDRGDAIGCSVDLNHLKSQGFDSPVLYSRWEIGVKQSKKFKTFSDSLKLPIPSFELVDLDANESRKTLNQCPPTVEISAPLPERIDASHIIFGVATSLDRLIDSLEAFSHWASGTNARIFALVEYDSRKNTVLQQAVELGIRLTLIESYEKVLDRYISLTRVLFRNIDENSQWGVVIDDDTFFPSMSNLIKRLASYDATVPQYVGALTENVMGLSNYGYMAYGGAGIFLSIPTLEELDKHYDECTKLTGFGDKRISQCIYLHTTTKLTWDRGLHQLDFWQSDGSGFYESGRELPLSLHHWKSADWFPVNIVGLSKVSSVCGDECQLRRRKLAGSDDWFFINGFSIIRHSYPVNDTIAMEQTWDPSFWAREEGWAYSLGPLRPRDDEKLSLRL
ncbi:uncharacterized protein N7498_007854 [Penicillium cinerascens]|uniref:Glycosyltransferase family 31 protein n=1 Tax=Penicillium cinerascens TaxID=70096 RepID=A0A9W9JLR0_9EURO|nr:uncharacterized protein N7498_007854 [Penicillium cinerascens]KAJ5198737.1 hypothetical protein N7498_007854 [Penicillium cinerascens]